MPSTLGARASRPQRIAENSRAGRPRTAHDLAPNRFPRKPDANACRLISLPRKTVLSRKRKATIAIGNTCSRVVLVNRALTGDRLLAYETDRLLELALQQ